MSKQRLLVIIASLAVSLGPAIFILFYPSPAAIQAGSPPIPAPLAQEGAAEKIDPALLAELADGAPGQTFHFILHLAASADLDPASLPAARAERAAAVVSRLQQTAAAGQAALLSRLAALQAAGRVTTYHPLWIINAVAVAGTAEAIHQLAARPDVTSVSLDARRRYFEPPTEMLRLALTPQVADTAPGSLSWGLARIRAPHAWHGLGIDGDGVTVAIVDSGVDWLHPDLNANYRGNLGNGVVEHAGNWYHAAYPTMTVPFDDIGHGTHVAGTAVGQNGIGVAPGAQWIAASIADQFGSILDSQVHAAFEWVLAPNGDPALAPDVVNNSWGGPGRYDAFLADVAALRAAGIIAVFAAGNAGPDAGTINAPASYPGALSVGASDDSDAVTWFSSRGPSSLTPEVKPLLVAPGARILSTLPGNQYGYSNGTSMATPHVAGAIALLLAANPNLTQAEIATLLAETAVPIDSPHPNDDSGWGRLDAYLTLTQVARHGVLRGRVAVNGVALPGVAITVTTASGEQLTYQSDSSGQYQAYLQPGTYTLAAAPFGYAPVTLQGIVVSAGQATIRDLNLAPLPAATIQGTIRDTAGGAPLPGATLQALNTPARAAADSSGRYTLSLPAGQYELVASAPAHRLARTTITAIAGQTINQNFTLPAAPSILLVDSGQWYYQSYAGYYDESLFALNYAHDRWSIRDPFSDVPTLADLDTYDTIIWSAPFDSPGYIGANNVITDFLGLGGNLLISGQNVGAYDGVGFGSQIWWYHHLAANFLGKTAPSHTVSGAPATHFAGLALSLNGGSSAGNQDQVDVAGIQKDALTSPAFYYDDGTIAGLHAGYCEPYHLVYLGYGLEGVSQAEDRQAILQRSFDTFQSPRQSAGARWLPGAIDDFAVPGSRLVYTLTLQNLSETMTDTFQFALSGTDWTSTFVTPTLTLGPCQAAQTVLGIDVPTGIPRDAYYSMQLKAISANTRASDVQINLRYKTPGTILFVDDDRWYNREQAYTDALDAMGLPYDLWQVGWDDEIRGSPPAHLLDAYDFILWHTGYDWFRPVTAAENSALVNYLSRGGRLFLSSQDFLYYHYGSALARGFLGVMDYRESITPTQLYGGHHPAVPTTLAGPLPLDYDPYQNFSDGLIAAPGSHAFWWHDQGMAAAVATASPGWRSLFLGLPFETLPPETQTAAIESVMGWLSDLGDSTFTAAGRTARAGEPLAYSLVLRNVEKGVTTQVIITNTLPAGLTLVPGSLTGDATYNPATRQISWQGTMQHDSSHTISYQAIPAATLAAGTRLDNPVEIHYYRRHQPRHSLIFSRTATVWVNAPDLTGSTLAAIASAPQGAEVVTYTLRLRNDGLAAAGGATAIVRLPDELVPITATLRATAGLVSLTDQRIFWEGRLRPGDAVTVSLALDYKPVPRLLHLSAVAIINDGVTGTWLEDLQMPLAPYSAYFPLIAEK